MILVLAALGGLACIGGPSPTPSKLLHIFTGSTMGTTFTVKVVATQRDAPRVGGLLVSIEAALEAVDAKMSHYRPDSEISRFNRFHATTPFAMSPETIAVIGQAVEISRLSGGAFDITVAPLVDAWGFGPAGPATAAPSEAALAGLRRRVGYAQLEIDREASTIRKRHPGITSDLSAIAKGHAVDRVAAALAEAGITDYLVEVGGELRAGGHNETGAAWRVAIERPLTGPPAVQRVVELRDRALATSGEYRNFYELDGQRVSHTIDPRSGRPVTHRVGSVSVVAERCVQADGIATALEVLGPDEGYRLAVERGWAALFVIRNPDGTFRERLTPAFAALVEER